MTDDTHDRDRAFADAGKSPETTGGGEAERSPAFDRADRTPAGTAEATQSTADRTGKDRTTENQTERIDQTDGAERTSRRGGTAARARTGGFGSDQPTLAGGNRTTVTDPNTDPSDESSDESSAESSGDRLEERLRAVERALTGTDAAVADVGDGAAASAEREELSTRLDDLEARVEELEAATQAIRGYVGSVRAVNQAVERRADLALARASENHNSAADGGPIAGDGSTAEGESIPDGDALGGDVPSEAALDAAVPSERHREREAGPTVDLDEADGDRADDSWGADALDRLRDSL